MTKQEVYSNIQYNENLIRQYTEQINRLHSQIADCNSQLSGYNGRKTQLYSALDQVKQQIRELEQLQKKIQTLQDKFSEKQNKRKSMLSKSYQNKPDVCFINSYISGMTELLSGTEYKNAYNGLVSAIESVKSRGSRACNEQDNITREIWQMEIYIENSNSRINSFRSDINHYNNQINYRRQRLNYWRQQLQYAT